MQGTVCKSLWFDVYNIIIVITFPPYVYTSSATHRPATGIRTKTETPLNSFDKRLTAVHRLSVTLIQTTLSMAPLLIETFPGL